ncbi:MAG: phosphocholine cytidylyltransferase family protein [Candidatus Saccharibacteria bacterium]
MKAVLLVAGFGSRLRPLTLDSPKSLLPIGDSNTLEHMMTKLYRGGIRSFVVVCGYKADTIKAYLAEHFPSYDITYVMNEQYETTNTGYSLLLGRSYLEGETFIKLDGDVLFDQQIVDRLVAAADGDSYVCVDNTAVDEEVIKVVCDADGAVLRIGNKLPVAEAAGESIGIERIDSAASGILFAELERMLQDPGNHQNYYEVAYDTIISEGAPFRTIDITGLHWVEMDNHDDYALAQKFFGGTKP